MPVGNLRSFVDSLQQRTQPTFASPESLSENELPDSFEEIEIDIEFDELDDLEPLTPKPQEPQDEKEPWDEDDDEEWDEDDDLFDFSETNEDWSNDDFTL